MRIVKFLVGGFLGAVFDGFVTALGQDRYGSLDAYVEHLRSPGVWWQGSTGTWIGLLVATFCFAVFLDSTVLRDGK